MSRRTDRHGRSARPARARRLNLEGLEGRDLLSLFTVTTAADNGDDANPTPGSLRAEIQLINKDTTNSGADSIQFQIPGSGVQTIALKATLPSITHAMAIDGTTQPGYLPNGTPLIVLDGSGAGAGANGLTITTGGGSTIRGLSIVGFAVNNTGFGGEGIYLAGPSGGNTIEGNYIGVEPDGVTGKGNSSGVLAFSPNNTIGGTAASTGNLISDNAFGGVVLANATATGNVVLGNKIGTNAAGTGTLGNQFGVVVIAPGNTIGGTAPNAGNLISGNVGPTGQTGAGILLEGQAPNNVIQGNRIGTNAAGTSALLPTNLFPNITYSNAYGIYFGSQGDTSNDNLAGETIGGAVAGAGNLISGNFIGMTGNVTSSAIQGNTIGLNLAGTAAIANSDGLLMGVSQSTIGGITPLARNVIAGSSTVSGAAGTGLDLSGDSDVVQGNYVGLSSSGLTPIGNVVGMNLNLTNSTIGGTTFGAGNVVSGNASDGIRLTGNGGTIFQGDLIGLNAQGLSAPNAGNGISLTIAAPATTPTSPLVLNDSIGGTVLGAGNTIADNGAAGVLVADNYPTGVTGLGIRGNVIFGNGRLGIDTQGTGVPIASPLFLVAASTSGGRVSVSGIYSGTPSSTVTIDLFANAADASGYGQGPVYLGAVNVTTNASGYAVFNPSFAAGAALYTSFSATYTGADGNTSEFTANYPTVASASQADLSVQATAASNMLVVGQQLTLVEKVFNTGPSTANSVTLYDTLPTSLVNLSVVSTAGAVAIGSNNVLTANIGIMPSNTFVTVTITGTVSQATTLVDQPGVFSTAFDPNFANNTAQQSITVTQGSTGPSADLAIAQSVSPASAVVNSPMTYTIIVGNYGPNAATNATVNDFLPAGVTLVGVTPSQGSSPSISGNLITENLGTIASGGFATIKIVVTPTAAGSITNGVNVSGNQYDPIPSNNATILATSVTAGPPNINLYLAQSATATTNSVGNYQGFILTFENFGTNAGTNVILNDALPSNATYVNAIPSQGGAPTLVNGLLSTNFGTIAPGGVATLQLILIPRSIGTLTNFAGVFTPDVPSAKPSYASASVSIIAGPSVSAINGMGNNSQLALTFNTTLNPTTATNPANYQLVALGKTGTGPAKTIAIASITYNATTRTVMILPAQAIDPTQYYKITVIGATSAGVADTQGHRLASTLYGAAGSNFSATFFAGTLPQV